MLAVTALRVTVVLAMALAVLPLLRHHSAALRAWILTAALACAAALPLLQLIAPAWGSPLESTSLLPAAGDWSQLAIGFWLTGAALHLGVLAAGMVRLMGVAAAADPVRDGRCADMALEIAAEYRVHAPVLLLESEHARLPVTWGHAQPKILLPPSARDWSSDRTRAVLCHEIAHVRRRDWLVQVFATVIRAIFWMHPLVWLACARLRLECERACDDAVLRSGIDASRYASHLLDLARGVLDERHPSAAAALALKSTLERRVRSMLSSQSNRLPVQPPVAAAAAMVIFAIAAGAAGYGSERSASQFTPPPAKRLTLLLDGRIMDLSKEWPSYPDPRAGVVQGPGFPHQFQLR